ncbi:unnamed protein product [Paramecium octaurelia]|uniref:TLDc domain-containing protein n=1 Tax=Paramecium octaurelia TaxID=43137 RepID=A0A8S1WGC7_PAROT|nr:unnamed protein product [Paramecium octaurelia]
MLLTRLRVFSSQGRIRQQRQEQKIIDPKESIQIEDVDARNQKSKSTPTLKFLCQNHGQEIIMAKLDEKNKLQYSCVECISKNQGKYITLQQLQQQFVAFSLQSERLLKYCLYLREQNMNQAITNFKELANRYNQTINLQITQLQENQKSFEEIVKKNLQFKNHNIYQLEQLQLLEILEPIFQDQNPNHYSKIIEKQLELDKQLNSKFEQQMKEFQMHNSKLIQFDQFDHQLISKKLEKIIGFYKLNQQDVQNDQEITNLENQINEFLLNKLQNNFLNECDKVDTDQEQLIEKIKKVQGQFKEKEIEYQNLEKLKTQLNSVVLCNSIESILSNPYQPQFNSSYKLAGYQIITPKAVSASKGGFGLAVMQPPLAKDKLTTFAFKINLRNAWAGVGICHLQTAQGFNYDMNANYKQTNHNVYIACAGGFRISSCGFTQSSFTYGENSIVHCQYDPKNNKLNLLHQNDGNTYQMEIHNYNLDMSPCVMLYGTAEIEQI